ncbi:CBS domain containing protein [Ferrimonas balearica DSM 9799]|uniref:Magnesium and cobalt efflux protein CorC n=1 Tax=Ferrimonas balearica (strain DSM 9799 / CCM 4581 / KCTC 23876 / PAT) TaxID=550540 RepID=E1SSB5_FERBD|nr:CNNM family magnesium/cobalt transport protein CorC [Ferrimonas balearica]ADN77047.1 CBS domain containing protein [Ferrimonas balearica DSM 9799]MBW3139958.1 CNNM family magnesium/cobalt transport protein CorC [Ferrimonas balearica]MBY6106934.1 CNNM family magnesium/cobalt transport protein CorC [Ferrimonas balearica]MBY6224509.1 CNNM family magnesium/cobalt transport protein CorC [Ferrimonas balearica]
MNEDQPPSSQTHAKKGWLDRLSHFFGGEPQNRQELVDVIQDAEDRALIDQDTKEMIKGVLEVSDLKVRDLMIPRSQMITIEKNQSVEEFLPIVIESAHSRFPVIDRDKDHIEGILLAKDMLAYGFGNDANFTLEQILRPAVVVPESKRVDVLLKEFRSDRYHMAIVVDEYGGVSGLITIEDVLEAIVGDIEDETDLEEENDVHIRRISRQVWAVAALTPIEEFNEHFDAGFSDQEYDTVGGLVSHAFGHLPERGEIIELNGFEFKVVNADTRRLVQLQVRLAENERDNEGENAGDSANEDAPAA